MVVSAALTRWQTKQISHLMLSVSPLRKKFWERNSSCLQCHVKTVSCLRVLLIPPDPLGPSAKRMSPVSFILAAACPVGRAGAVWWCGAVTGWEDGFSVRCYPAAHMVGGLVLWVWVPSTVAGSRSACAVQSCSLWQLVPTLKALLDWESPLDWIGSWWCVGVFLFRTWRFCSLTLNLESQGCSFIAEEQSHKYLYLFFLGMLFYTCCLKMNHKQNVGSSQLQKLHLDLAALPLGCEGTYK